MYRSRGAKLERPATDLPATGHELWTEGGTHGPLHIVVPFPPASRKVVGKAPMILRAFRSLCIDAISAVPPDGDAYR